MTAVQQSGALDSPVRRALYDHLVAHPEGASAAQLAALLEQHITTTRFHIDRLIQAGLVSAFNERGGTAGRPTKRYVAIEPSAGPTPYQLLAEVLTSAVDTEASPEEAGFRWALTETSRGTTTPLPADSVGTWLGKVGVVVDMLDEWGYGADIGVSSGGQQVDIGLNECPFRELAEAKPEVVCAVHRGLIRGALAAAGEPSVKVSLDVFLTPDRCLARLTHDRPWAERPDRPSRSDKHKEES